MMNVPIRVVLADDHAVVRRCTRDLLEDEADLLVEGEAEDGQQAIEFALALRPDVVLMDVRMPVLTGVEATRRIRTDAPEVMVVVLTGFDDEPYIRALMHAGAHAYVLKTAEGREIVQAIRVAHSGRTTLDSTMPS